MIKLNFSKKNQRRVEIISFPKSGRTWLSVMVGKYLVYYYNLTLDNYNIAKELSTISKELVKMHIPNIKIHHDGYTFWQRPEEVELRKDKYKRSSVILLVRNPIDIIVSSYFEKNKRVPARMDMSGITDPYLEPFNGTISEYVYERKGGIDTIIKFYNNWVEQSKIPKNFKIVKYEELHANTSQVLYGVLSFLSIPIKNEILTRVVDETTFQNMQKEEKSKKYESYALQPGNKDDKESFKARKGKIGGYSEYLVKSEIDYLKGKISSDLHPVFGY